MQDSKLWMVWQCKISRYGWFRPSFSEANRPHLEILSKILKNQNESMITARAHHPLLEVLTEIQKIQNKALPSRVKPH